MGHGSEIIVPILKLCIGSFDLLLQIKKYGVVSNQIAMLMVKNLQNLSKSKLCISTTGIAGPSGGTKIKPVGLIFFGINYKSKIPVFQKKFKGSRSQIQNKTVDSIFITLEKLI